MVLLQSQAHIEEKAFKILFSFSFYIHIYKLSHDGTSKLDCQRGGGHKQYHICGMLWFIISLTQFLSISEKSNLMPNGTIIIEIKKQESC